MGVKQGNVKWVDGLRGVASFLVVVTHLTRAFDPDLFSAASSENARPRLAQWPIIRVIFQGRIGVAIFSLVTGYVCSLKPIRQARNGNVEGALNTVARSAFRRVPRLVLPTTLMTVITWLLCQFGVFVSAKNANNGWLSFTAPEMTPYFGNALRSLMQQVIETWVWGRNAYDPNQWTLQPLLKGSMLVYVSLFATVYLQPKYRMMASMTHCVYYYISNDSAFGMQFYFGMFLADLQNHPPAQQFCTSNIWARRILSPILITFGLFLASYPESGAEWTSWSRALILLATYIIPTGHDVPRFFAGLGVQLIVLGIYFSPRVCDLLSNRYFLWLGRQSFAIYLVHGPLLRSVLVWFLYVTPPPVVAEDGTSEANGEAKLEMRNWPAIACVLPLWFILMYSCAALWTRWVDPMCSRWTQQIEQYLGVAESEKGGLPAYSKSGLCEKGRSPSIFH